MKKTIKKKILVLLNEANVLLNQEVDDDNDDIINEILCPLGEAISNIENLD